MENFKRPDSDMLKIRTWEMPMLEKYFLLGLILILKNIGQKTSC